MDIEKHRAVPEHRILDEDELQKILEKYGIEKEKLPKIERNDAALKPKDASVGDVIEITRDSPTAGTTKYYRQVIE